MTDTRTTDPADLDRGRALLTSWLVEQGVDPVHHVIPATDETDNYSWERDACVECDNPQALYTITTAAAASPTRGAGTTTRRYCRRCYLMQP